MQRLKRLLFLKYPAARIMASLIMQKIVNHAKHNKKTVHITWFDLEDAFGSVSHDLIPVALKQIDLPENIKLYIVSLDSKLKGKVKTADWISNSFDFDKGVFQGDPLSLIIFLASFNPNIERLQRIEDIQGRSQDSRTPHNLSMRHPPPQQNCDS
jgi:hypothetical protein